jgi:branched-chain amino acid transport system permease protein
MMGVGFSLVFGIMRVINFSYGEMYMLAGYSTIFLYLYGVPLPVIMVVNIILFFILGMFIERTLILPARKAKDWMATIIVVTMGLQIVLQSLALVLFGGTYRGITHYMPGRFQIGSINFVNERVMLFFVSLIILTFVLLLINKTKFGLSMRAVAQNKEAALLLGINENKIYLITFGISSVIIALAGTVFVPQLNVHPNVGLKPMNKAFAVTLLGGLGHVNGAIIGGFILGIAEALAGAFISTLLKDAIAFLIMIAILIIYPGGIHEGLRAIRERLSRKGAAIG